MLETKVQGVWCKLENKEKGENPQPAHSLSLTLFSIFSSPQELQKLTPMAELAAVD